MSIAFFTVLALVFVLIGALYKAAAFGGSMFLALARMPSKKSPADVWVPRVMFTAAGISFGWAVIHVVRYFSFHLIWT